ncbi:methyl-accepting chemotaxis protein [Gracilibacillus suaedae]|uniref:methyl-accepting chemotaxis protein n=1 Tax=Gracilibacillus suaedae TaxID=2820273 RepID=UPI001ABE85A8|nr:methyl-accepting chemotaxis protein [Gracilibacillus suaedae]
MKNVFHLKNLRFKNVKIGTKYGLILSVVLSLFVISAVLVSFFLQNVQSQIEAMERRGDRAVDVTEMGSLIRAKGIRVFQYMEDPTSEVVNDFNQRKDLFKNLEDNLAEELNGTEAITLVEKIIELDEAFNLEFNEVISYVGQGDMEMASQHASQAHTTQREVVQALEELTEMVNADRANAVKEAKTSQTMAIVALVIAIAVSLIISIILIIIVNRTVSKNLNKVVDVSNSIADGNLLVKNIEYKGNDEIGQLSSSINKMSTNLRKIIQQVSTVSDTVTAQSEELNQSANEVKSGTEQIASTMQELASGAETQANHAGDVASKMSDFSQKVHEADQNGEKIEGASANVLSMAENGNELMSSSVAQMGRIHTIVQEAVEKVRGLDNQSKEITKLVAVIKDIAEQTNLLALNAAIESARAGEHGKGFAVVADEVRKLAEQVAESVNDITGIVTNIQSESSNVTQSLEEGYGEVEAGSEQIEKTGETFEQINHAVTEMVSSITTVTTNLSDMRTSSEEINSFVEEIASISEESAAGVEQTSASAQQASSAMEEVSSNSEDLAKLAEELNGLVRQFKI